MADEDKDIPTKRLWIAVLVAIAGGNASGIFNALSPVARNDPMTGTEGRRMELELHRIDSIQQTMLYRMGQREKEDDAMLELLRMHMQDHQ